jgi:hypothetical protein
MDVVVTKGKHCYRMRNTHMSLHAHILGGDSGQGGIWCFCTNQVEGDGAFRAEEHGKTVGAGLGVREPPEEGRQRACASKIDGDVGSTE